ncbi:MAG TPA: glycosyltransferase family 2 protein [Solirubrobacteraceae bacterium]|nr:glycosyltransferase family 2 protein [Solirubrobacteraceae bacterium]
MTGERPGRVLRVQSVLFGHQLSQLWRLLHGLDAAACVLLDSELATGVEWAMGDSSPGPVLGDPDTQAMHEATGSLSNVTYEFFGENLGSSGGQNRLADRHASDLLLVLNPDTYPSPTALVELVRAVDEPGVGIAEARQIPLEHPRVYDERTGDTSWASGYCMMLRRPVFDQLNGFDSATFLLHCDDVDLSWRARRAGHRVVTAPRAAVFHDKRPTHGEGWPAPDYEIYHSALGRLMLARRWDRPDILEQTERAIDEGGVAMQRAALEEFKARVADGRVPASEPDPAQIAQFIDGEYAEHRF